MTNTRLLTFTTMRAELPHTLPCLLVLLGQPHGAPMGRSRAAGSPGFSMVDTQVQSWKRRFEVHMPPGTSTVTATAWQSHLKITILASTLFFPYHKDQPCTCCLHKDKFCSFSKFWVQQRPGVLLPSEPPASSFPFSTHKNSISKKTGCLFSKVYYNKI